MSAVKVRARALRGFRLAPGVDVAEGEIVELERSVFTFMASANAVERAPEETAPTEAAAEAEPAAKAAAEAEATAKASRSTKR